MRVTRPQPADLLVAGGVLLGLAAIVAQLVAAWLLRRRRAV